MRPSQVSSSWAHAERRKTRIDRLQSARTTHSDSEYCILLLQCGFLPVSAVHRWSYALSKRITMGKPITSCDRCRRSRLGCNAVSQNGQACYNCFRKGAKCEFTPSMPSAKSHGTINMSEIAQDLPDGVFASAVEPPALFTGAADWGALAEGSSETESSTSDWSLTTSLSTVSDTMAKTQQALTLHHLLWNVFHTLLEPRIGLWMGGAACPLLTTSTVSINS